MNRLIIICLVLAFASQANPVKAKEKDLLAVADSLYRTGMFKDAIPVYERALKVPANAVQAQLWFRLGSCHHNLKDYPKALEAYRKAEKINARLPFLRLSMAKVLSATGDVKASAVVLDSAARQGFGNYKLLDTDPEFANLRKDPAFAAIRSRIYGASHPCENNELAHQFDFWIGEWDVFVTASPATKAGTSNITRQSGGCVILESWESQGPHSGVSINYFDPSNGKWKQKWAGSSQDITEFYDGEYKDNMMRFKFDNPGPNGVGAGRLTFTNMSPSKVRQHSEQTTDGGKTWTTVYDFMYLRR
jgi:tetratricopeptide (TPR) repeat protein